MLTKKVFRETIESLIEHNNTASTLNKAGVDMTASPFSTCVYNVFENMVRSHFTKEDCDIIVDWVYERVFDVQGKTKHNLDLKVNYIYDGNKVVVDNFDSLCEYYGITDDIRPQETVTLDQATTGLGHPIWVSSSKGRCFPPHIVVGCNGGSVYVSVCDKPVVIADEGEVSKLDKRTLAEVTEWILANKEILTQHYSGTLTTKTLLDSVKRLDK